MIVEPPFTLGVASGEPWAHGVVLWTRLAPDPLNGGGMAPRNVKVRWEVARDPRMSRVLRRGVAIAQPRLGHSLRVPVGVGHLLAPSDLVAVVWRLP